MRLLLLLSIGFLLSSSSLKAQSETWYSARVNGLTDQNEEILNEYFQQQTGIVLFRADFRTETILIAFTNAQLSQEQVLQFMSQQGLTVICDITQDNPSNIRQRLMSKCFKEDSHVEPQIEQK